MRKAAPALSGRELAKTSDVPDTSHGTRDGISMGRWRLVEEGKETWKTREKPEAHLFSKKVR